MNPNQHRKPCPTCPFRRTCTPGALGGENPATTFIGQAFGNFWIPCHEQIDYTDRNWRTNYDTPQCAGVAIYRSNAHPAERKGMNIVLPADKDLVFASPAEFLAHHMHLPLEVAQLYLHACPPQTHWVREMQRAEARVITV